MLSVDGLEVRYGRITALRGISLEVAESEFVGLVGPNGAGKSTLVNTVAGVVPAAAGQIRFEDRALLGTAPERIVQLGISAVPEGRQIFARLTVRENLELGATIRSDRDGVKTDIERVFERFPVLHELEDGLAGKLSGGEQQQLAIARALLARPRLLMLDEPSLGLAPLVIDEVFAWLRELHADGTTILLVEQNGAKTIEVADRTYVLRNGEVVREIGEGQTLDTATLLESYLGAGSGR
jgi:branched-chain amino acid transport system ATP-binding protein